MIANTSEPVEIRNAAQSWLQRLEDGETGANPPPMLEGSQIMLEIRDSADGRVAWAGNKEELRRRLEAMYRPPGTRFSPMTKFKEVSCETSRTRARGNLGA